MQASSVKQDSDLPVPIRQLLMLLPLRAMVPPDDRNDDQFNGSSFDDAMNRQRTSIPFEIGNLFFQFLNTQLYIDCLPSITSIQADFVCS